jgi:hypothetical protein
MESTAYVAVTALNNQVANRLVSIGATTTELDGEANLTFNGSNLAVTGTVTATGFTIGSAAITETELEILDGATLSTTELNYVDGVSSAIQTQIDGKSPTAGHASIATVGTIGTGVWEGTDVGVSHGGTGASSAGDARTNLGLVIGTNVQAFDADLASLSSCQSGGAAALAALTSTEIGILDGATVTSAEANLLDAIPRGNIIIGNASAASARLAPGDVNEVLTSDGTDISWASASGGGAASDDSSLILHMQMFT